jgi:hypothetical protein
MLARFATFAPGYPIGMDTQLPPTPQPDLPGPDPMPRPDPDPLPPSEPDPLPGPVI